MPVIGLGLQAFYNCTNLNAFPGSLTYIGGFVFSGCSNLTTLMIPDSVNTIGNGAFDSCISVTNLTLGTNVATVKIGVSKVRR